MPPSRANGNGSGRRPPAGRATLARPEEIWGRRSVAIGVALVTLAWIGGLILLIGGRGGDGDSISPSKPANTESLQQRFLERTVTDRDNGISIRRPAAWKVSRRHGVSNIQSKDRCLAMQLSAPVPAGKADELRRDGITVLRGQFQDAKVEPAPKSRIGGIPTTTSRVSVKGAKGNGAAVLLSVGAGRKNAYLTEIVVRDASCQGDLQLAQLMLQSARFSK